MALQVKFGVSTWLWTSPFSTASAEELFPRIAAMGYDAVEIAVEDPALINAQRVKELLQANGLKAVVCGAFGASRDLTHDDPAVQKGCLQYIEDSLEMCAVWDAGFFAGPMYAAVGKARMLPPDARKAEWELAVKNLQKVCGMAAARGLQIALEPLNRFESDLVNRAADVMRLIGDIGHPAAKVVLDGFHMNIEEPDLEQAVRETGDKLIHVQVSENYRGAPGTGQTRWDALYRGLQTVNYQGVVSIESFTPNNKELARAVCIWRPLAASQDTFATEGLAFLRSWARHETPVIN
jgi:D-psicose/D-tagatose/L-ribulose 3-epimerase